MGRLRPVGGAGRPHPGQEALDRPWNLLAKYDEHVLSPLLGRGSSFGGAPPGGGAQMEVDFETSPRSTHQGLEELADKLVICTGRRGSSRRTRVDGRGGTTEVNYVYTTDFTNGRRPSRATCCSSSRGRSRAAHQDAPEQRHTPDSRGRGRRRQCRRTRASALLRQASNSFAASQALRQPPTSSPRLDAILLQDQLKREMRERQARYTGICPVRERIYAAVFDELIAAVARDLGKRGSVLKRVHAESRMFIDAYRTVFEKSIDFGGRKLTQALQTKGQLAEMIEGLEGEIAGLKKSMRTWRIPARAWRTGRA